MADESIRKGIVLLVKNTEGKYLLLKQRKDNSYSLISGGCEPGESEIDTVVREAKEEAGIVIDKSKIVDTGKNIQFTGGSKGPAQQQIFLYEINDENIKIQAEDTEEIKAHEWCSKEEAIDKLSEKPPLVQVLRQH